VRRDSGFTLIEIMAVMVIAGVLFSVAVKKHINISDSAKMQAIATAAAELRSRESLTWFREQLAGSYRTDADLFVLVDKALGDRYSWVVGPLEAGGRLDFDGVSADLVRTPSTEGSPGSWRL